MTGGHIYHTQKCLCQIAYTGTLHGEARC
jgi:hypothetical protein